MNFYSSTVSATTSPVLIFSDPIPDGLISLYLNASGVNQLFCSLNLLLGTMTQIFSTQSIDGNDIIVSMPDNTNIYINYIYNSPTSNGFFVSADHSWSDVQICAKVEPQTLNGLVTFNNVYNSSGLVQNSLTWSGSATTSSSGAFTADISSAGFTTITSVQVSAVGTTGLALTTPLASVTSTSATSISGVVILPGLTGGVFAGSGITVYVTVFGQ